MISNVDVTVYPPSELLPADVAALVSAADSAYQKLDDYEQQHGDLLRDNWKAIAEAKDIENAVQAAQAGRDPFKGASEMTKARDSRARVLGVHRVLVADYQQANQAAKRALRAVVADIEPVLVAELKSAADAYTEAHRAFLDARAAFGGTSVRASVVRRWRDYESPDWFEGGANPMLANGGAPRAENPQGEIREVLASFEETWKPEPIVKLRGPNGNILELRESQARALVGSAPGLEIISESE